MLSSAAWVLATATICLCSSIPNDARSPDSELVQPEPRDNAIIAAGQARTGYVRIPVKRHMFQPPEDEEWGWHWTPPPWTPDMPYGPPPPLWPGQPFPGYATPSGGPWPTAWPTPSPWPTTWPSTWPRPSWPTGGPWGSMPGKPRASATPTTSISWPPGPTSTGKTGPRYIAPRKLSRRWGWEHLEELGGIAYALELQIGTPPQAVKVFIDTGSYELWVNPRCNTSADPRLCNSYGMYYPYKSNSSTYVGGSFAVAYGTGAARGVYWADMITMAMFQIPAVQFAVASDSNYTFTGILGLGYSYPYSINYPSVLNLMVSNKLISAPIFSLGLGGEQDGFSEIIFGGVNRWKFAGPLEPVQIWPAIADQNPVWIQYWVNVTSVGMTIPGQKAVIYTPKTTFTMPVLIDTGSTLSYFRADLVAIIGEKFNATVDRFGNYIVDCSYRNKTGTVDFGFNRGRMVINVRYKDFLYEQYPGHCMLGCQPADAGSTNYVLGDTFIRGAYLVFDQQSDIVWMNQYYNCGDGVVTVGQSPKDTGNIVGAC